MDAENKITCLNCGHRFSAGYAYCPHCGQANRKNDLSLKYVISEFLSANFNLDAKIFNTLRLLLFSPGKLTREYLDGKRQQYVSPVRLYLLFSLVYFFLLSVVPAPAEIDEVRVGTMQNVSVAGDSVNNDYSLFEIEDPAEKSDTLSGFEKMLLAKANRLESKEGKRIFSQNMRKNISTGMLVMLPFTALLLYFLFYRNSYYFEHLIFIVHLQTVWFIVAGVYLLVHFVLPFKVLFYIEAGLLLSLTFLWFKRFYKIGTAKTIWKMALFFAAFGLLLVLFFVVVALISLLFVPN